MMAVSRIARKNEEDCSGTMFHGTCCDEVKTYVLNKNYGSHESTTVTVFFLLTACLKKRLAVIA